MQKFIGTGVALVTPFKKDFSVDTEALTRIVNHVINGGVEYLVVLGTTAESATLSNDEKELVIETIVKANNNIDTLTSEKYDLQAEYRKLEAEVGPVKYLAEFIYGETANQDILEEKMSLRLRLLNNQKMKLFLKM